MASNQATSGATSTPSSDGEAMHSAAGEGAQVSRAAGRRREDRIVGASEATRKLIAQATSAARSDLPVWVTGREGTDKILVARAIHSWGARTSESLEVLTCSAIPEALQGRELFGCTEGVYPAVPGEYAGALERAGRTTLLLDGVEELRAEVRGPLLQAIGSRRFRREGENADRTLSARVIVTAAADSELGELPHHEIHLVPLAERREDVLSLALHYLRAFAEEAGLQPIGFTADARACLEAEEWAGDVLELRARVREAVRLGGGAVSAEALVLARDADDIPSFKEAKRAFETRYVESLLRRCNGNISRAARLARKDRKDFYDVIRRTGVNPQDFRA